MPDENKIAINPMVALAEANALAEFYRNRALAFHQRLFDASQPPADPEAPAAQPEKDAE